MADSGDSASSWPGFLSELNKTFGLVRDVFGYALPGAVFLAIGVMAHWAGHGGISLAEVRKSVPFAMPSWAAFLGLLAACYAIGDIVAAIAYMPLSVMKWIQWRPIRPLLYPLGDDTALDAWRNEKHADKRDLGHKADLDRYRDNPTEVTGDLLVIRLRHPEFFLSLDRRETLSLMSGSMCVAVLGGWLVFYVGKFRAMTMLPLAGAILLVQFLTGLSHLRRVRRAIREADAAAPKDPPKTPVEFKGALQDLIKAAADALGKLSG